VTLGASEATLKPSVIHSRRLPRSGEGPQDVQRLGRYSAALWRETLELDNTQQTTSQGLEEVCVPGPLSVVGFGNSP